MRKSFGSKAVDPNWKNSAILPNIRVPWKSLADKLTITRKEFNSLDVNKWRFAR